MKKKKKKGKKAKRKLSKETVKKLKFVNRHELGFLSIEDLILFCKANGIFVKNGDVRYDMLMRIDRRKRELFKYLNVEKKKLFLKDKRYEANIKKLKEEMENAEP